MKNDKTPITLRLDSDIHEALKLISAREMRSLNTQIEYMLRNAVLEYEKPNCLPTTRLDKLIRKISVAHDQPDPDDE